MILLEFGELLLTADPKATHYIPSKEENYTVWAEHGANSLIAEDTESEQAWKIQIDRFTKMEHDPVVQAITDLLNAAGIGFEYLVDPEPDTGYIHHIWDCEVE